MSSKTFFITGCTTGFGKHYAEIALKNGHKVVATSRKPDTLPKFEGATSDNYLAVGLDVTDRSSVSSAFDEAVKKFETIDVVCNNAGFGLSGEFESLSEKQIRMQMEVNFFGLLWVTKRALEVMREQKTGGRIQQVTSIGGQTGVPLFSTYCASKWAVEGFTEALQQELKPEWNISLTCIEPGGFRTEWAGDSMIYGEEKNPAYDHLNAEKTMKERNGTQAGDPVKGAQAFYELGVMDDPPLRVVVGTDAYKRINQKIETYSKNIPKYEKLSNSTDVDE